MFKTRQKNKGLFLVFEGVDGAGKTTCAKGVIELLKGKYEFCYLKGIGSETIIGRLAKKYPSTILFCLELIFITLFKIRKALKNGRIVLQDRYNFTIASHPNAKRKINQLLIDFLNPVFKNPDLIIYFTVSLDKRLQRLKPTVDNNRHHRILVENPELILLRENKYQKLLKAFKDRLVIIDTSTKKERETVSQVAKIIDDFAKYQIKTC